MAYRDAPPQVTNIGQVIEAVTRDLPSRPIFTAYIVRVICRSSTFDKVRHIANAYSRTCDGIDEIKKVHMAREWQTETAKSFRDAIHAEKTQSDGTLFQLMLSIDVPFLVDTLTDRPELLRHRYIADNGWWDNPSASPLWNDCQSLLDSSQKLQIVEFEALAREERASEVKSGAGRVVKVKHYDKIIFAAHQPLLAFCAYVVLLQSLKDRYGGIKGAMDAIKVVWRGDNMTDVANKFQLKPKGNTYYHPSVDIVIILSGISFDPFQTHLTNANRLLMIDVDPCRTNMTQLKMLHQSFRQNRDATFIQLVSDLFGIQATMIRRRDNGEECLGGVISLRRQENFLVTKRRSKPMPTIEGGDNQLDEEDNGSSNGSDDDIRREWYG